MMTGHGKGDLAVGGPARHIPVLLGEVLAALSPQPGETIIDGLGRRSFYGLTVLLFESRHIGADGIVGTESLQDQRVLLDFAHNRMAVGDARSLGGNTGYEIVVTARVLACLSPFDDGIQLQDIVLQTCSGSAGRASNLEEIPYARPVVVRFTAPELFQTTGGASSTPGDASYQPVREGSTFVLRVEIEMALLEGSLSIADLPDAWRARMREYVGVEPATDSQGALQDVHWSGGSFGAFPGYTVGNVMSAQLLEAAHQQVTRPEPSPHHNSR